MFVRDASTGFSTSGNQYYNSSVQLSAGVRLLSGQIHKSNGGWHLCHSSCDLLDAGLLQDWLDEVKEWLDNNPNEVVTILLVNSDNASPSQLAAEFNAAPGIVNYAYIPPSTTSPPATWPTLQELINQNKRLMVFIGSLDPSQISSNEAFLMDEFTFMFENKYDNIEVTDFSCSPDRPTAVQGSSQAAFASNRMAFTNHFLYAEGLFDIQTPDVENITTTNSPGQAVGNLGWALSTCSAEYQRQPTFVLVDFFDEGPAIQAVDTLNGITPVGRTPVPPRDTEDDLSRVDNTFQGVRDLNAKVAAGEQVKLGAWIWAGGKWTLGGINLSGGSILE